MSSKILQSRSAAGAMMLLRFFLTGLVAASLLGVSACTHDILIEAVPKAQITSHTWDNLDGAGDPLGETPLRVDAEKLTGKVIKLQAPEKAPQYIAFPGESQGELRLKINMQKAEENQQAWQAALKTSEMQASLAGHLTAKDVNRLNREMLAAFQAILDEDYASAVGIADRLAKEAPNLAAPKIITALAKLQLGKTEEARVSLKMAQSLDPDDAAVNQMLKAIK